MTKYTIRNTVNRGFTLIELMIVIVILGVLMGTILPRLTGAQARARDLGRTSDLNTIAQALTTYYDDNEEYPGTVGSAYCLDEAYEGTNSWLGDLGDYLKGSTLPKPPQKSQITAISSVTSVPTSFTASAPCKGSYVYIPLYNRGLPNNGYALISDVETYQNANVNLANTTPAIPGLSATAKAQDFANIIDSANVPANSVLKTIDEAQALNTVFMIVN